MSWRLEERTRYYGLQRYGRQSAMSSDSLKSLVWAPELACLALSQQRRPYPTFILDAINSGGPVHNGATAQRLQSEVHRVKVQRD